MSSRATGMTTYLENGGTLEHAQQIAAHESPRTTRPSVLGGKCSVLGVSSALTTDHRPLMLYDRTKDQVSLDEIERIAVWGWRTVQACGACRQRRGGWSGASRGGGGECGYRSCPALLRIRPPKSAMNVTEA